MPFTSLFVKVCFVVGFFFFWFCFIVFSVYVLFQVSLLFCLPWSLRVCTVCQYFIIFHSVSLLLHKAAKGQLRETSNGL